MQNENEQDIQKTIIDYLRLKKFIVFKHHSTGSTVRNNKAVFFKHGDKGVSDLIACSPKGQFVAIEIKKNKGSKISDDQYAFIKNIILNKGIAFVAFSIDDVVKTLKKFT